MTSFDHILIAFDDSAPAQRAFEMATDLALRLHSRVTLVTVLEPLPGYVEMAAMVDAAMPETLREAKQARLQALQTAACDRAKEKGLDLKTVLLESSEVSGLLEAIRTAAPDLLVIGRQAHSSSLEFAGTVRGVVNESSCPLLAIA